MREYKFRAFHRPTNTMIQPDKLESINFDTKVLGVYMEIDGKGFHKLRMSDFELMQYTGLKDKNGKEIYEGDVLSNGSHIDWIVIYEEASFKVKFPDPINTDRFELKRWMGESREVIGNIYENPELVGEQG